jgi:hypothetical protein
MGNIDRVWEWFHRTNTALGLIAVVGGVAVNAALQSVLSFFSRPTLPWWGYMIVCAASCAVIWFVVSSSRQQRDKPADAEKKEEPQQAAETLRDRVLQLGRDLVVFVKEKGYGPLKPTTNEEVMGWLASDEYRTYRDSVIHGYELRFSKRVADMFNELREHGLKYDGIGELEANRQVNDIKLVEDRARACFNIVKEMDISRELLGLQLNSAKSPLSTSSTPRFIVKCPKGKENKLTLINEGAEAAISVCVGPWIHVEEHKTEVNSAFGSISPKGSAERILMVSRTQTSSISSLWDAMRERRMEPQSEDSASITFGDLHGNSFSQRFTLTSETDGSVTWLPETVKLV